jgi:hypothetical protein
MLAVSVCVCFSVTVCVCAFRLAVRKRVYYSYARSFTVLCYDVYCVLPFCVRETRRERISMTKQLRVSATLVCRVSLSRQPTNKLPVTSTGCPTCAHADGLHGVCLTCV